MDKERREKVSNCCARTGSLGLRQAWGLESKARACAVQKAALQFREPGENFWTEFKWQENAKP